MWKPLAELGNDVCNGGRTSTQVCGERPGVTVLQVRTSDLHPRPEGGGTVAFPTAAHQHRRVALAGNCSKFFCQPSFTNARLAS